MHAADLVAAWEEGRGRTPGRRGLSLLGLLGVDAARRPGLSVGQRDALLLDLRGELFGPAVVAVTSCPGCGERVELDFDVDDVRVPPPGDPTEAFEFRHDGYTVRARPPTAGDLVALETARSAPEGRALLLGRCVVSVRRGDAEVALTELPDGVHAELAARMAEADPQADTRLVLTCPACGRTWSAIFDIVSFLWQELDDWTRGLLQDVHGLASVYGWSEADILAMSPARRTLYLDLVRR
ncbi:T4 family baseplate hub assembly chaperone [Geodermatophilus sp. SYSU D01105]